MPRKGEPGKGGKPTPEPQDAASLRAEARSPSAVTYQVSEWEAGSQVFRPRGYKLRCLEGSGKKQRK